MRTPSVLVALSLLAGCTGTVQSDHYGRHWLKDPRMHAWHELDAQKAKVNRESVEPQMQEHSGCGTLFVWSHKLSGGPDWEFLRASFTYQNTEKKKFDMVRVWLEVLDAEGAVVNRKEEVLMDPLGYALGPGDTYSDVLRVPTKGAHRREGWTWRIGCEPVAMKQLPQRPYGG